MTNYKTLRIPQDAYDAAREAKRERETWGDFVQRCSQTPPEVREFVDAAVAEHPQTSDTVTLDASEHRKIAEAVAEVLGR